MTFQILSLSGGGFLGLYSITLLAQLEQQIGRPIASAFDLLAGTSVGGIIALGLAAESPAEKIKSAFETNGSLIFSDRPAPKNAWGEIVDFCRSFRSSKYDDEGLRNTIAEILGKDALIGHLKHPVVIPTVNLTKGKPQVFKTSHHPDLKLDHRLRLVDVALAASAAPTYFPLAQIGDQLFADGGLYANSPDLIALHEAEHFFNAEVSEVRILSVGTTTSQFSVSHVRRRNLGLFWWRRRFPGAILASQQLDIDYIIRHRLGNRYLRVDEVQSKEQERDLGLDVATDQAQRTIRALAAGSYQEVINHKMLNEILNHRAPKPRFFHLDDGQTETKW